MCAQGGLNFIAVKLRENLKVHNEIQIFLEQIYLILEMTSEIRP